MGLPAAPPLCLEFAIRTEKPPSATPPGFPPASAMAAAAVMAPQAEQRAGIQSYYDANIQESGSDCGRAPFALSGVARPFAKFVAILPPGRVRPRVP